MPRIAIALTCCALLSACATIPVVTYTYYLPKSATTLSLTQTLTCAGGQFVAVSAVQTPSTAYSANYEKSEPLETTKFEADTSLGRDLSDTDVNISFYDDGRLKGINATMTGEGETVLKSAISLGSSLAGLSGALMLLRTPLLPGRGAVKLSSPCQAVKDWAGEGKSATLTYTTIVDLNQLAEHESIRLNDGSDPRLAISDRVLYDKVKPELPDVIVSVSEIKPVPPYAKYTEQAGRHAFTINMQKTANVRIDFYTCRSQACPQRADKTYDYSKANWAGGATVLVPDEGDTYALAIPSSEVFGTGKMVLAVSEAGAIQTLEYSRTSGAAGAMNVAANAATTATPAPASASPPAPPTQIQQITVATQHPAPGTGGP